MKINLKSKNIGFLPKELFGFNFSIPYYRKQATNGGNYFGAVGSVTAGTFNLASGKFKVDENGRLTAVEADISGKITSLTGNIGSFNIGQSGLISGQPWALNNDFLSLSPGDFIFRKIGKNTSQVIEAAFGYAGMGVSDGLRLKNTISGTLYTNTALSLEARNGLSESVALNIIAGDIKVQGLKGQTIYQDIGGGWHMRFVNGIFVGSVKL